MQFETLLSFFFFLNKKSVLLTLIDIMEDCNITQYSLEYITEQTKEMQDYHITNVENYKKNLYIYPISEGSYLSQC